MTQLINNQERVHPANLFNARMGQAIEEVLGACERGETNIELIVGLLETHKFNLLQLRAGMALRKQKGGILPAQTLPTNLPKVGT